MAHAAEEDVDLDVVGPDVAPRDAGGGQSGGRGLLAANARVMAAKRSGFRHQLEDAALGAVGQQIERAVGALSHVANALALRLQVLQQALFAHDLLALQRQPHQVRCCPGRR